MHSISESPASTVLTSEPFRSNVAEVAELEEKSERLSRILTDLGVGEGSLIPVCLDHPAESIIAMLGIVKSGGKYLLLDTNDSPGDIADILNDTGSYIVISTTTCNHLLSYGANLIINLDEPF